MSNDIVLVANAMYSSLLRRYHWSHYPNFNVTASSSNAEI